MLDEARTADPPLIGAAANITRQIAELSGLMAPPAPPRKKRPKEHADPLEAMRARLVDVQDMRMNASDRGSYDSAARLMRIETQLVSDIAALVRTREQDKGTVSDQQLVDEVAADLLAMPPVMRRAVLAIVQAGSVTRSPDAKPSN
jgi:hypothetical protein